MGSAVAYLLPTYPAATVLGRLPEDVRRRFVAEGVCQRYPKLHRVLREGAQDSHVLLLVRGVVKVTSVIDGYDVLLAIRIPGDILGETAALTGRTRSATVTACGPIVASLLTQAAVERFLDANPVANRAVAASVSERLRWANERRLDFVAYRASVRLARLLVEIAAICGRPDRQGVILGIPLSQAELATTIGSASATIHKAVRELREFGLIRSRYRTIVIPDVEALAAFGAQVE